MFSSPIKDGGLNILMPDNRAHAGTKRMTEKPFENDTITKSIGHFAITESIRKEKRNRLKKKRSHLIDEFDNNKCYSPQFASEKDSQTGFNVATL